MNKREYLEQQMERLGWKPDDLAERAGIARTSVYKFLNGLDLRLSSWEKIEAVLADPSLQTKQDQEVQQREAGA